MLVLCGLLRVQLPQAVLLLDIGVVVQKISARFVEGGGLARCALEINLARVLFQQLVQLNVILLLYICQKELGLGLRIAQCLLLAGRISVRAQQLIVEAVRVVAAFLVKNLHLNELHEFSAGKQFVHDGKPIKFCELLVLDLVNSGLLQLGAFVISAHDV